MKIDKSKLKVGNNVIDIKDKDGKLIRRKVIFKCDPVSKTKQSMAAACDINNIMVRYEKTGLIDHVKQGGSYGDFSNVQDYHASMNAVLEANEAFMTLPAKLRKEFNNDPSQLIEFMNDPKNKEKAEELGLIEKIKEVPVNPPPTDQAKADADAAAEAEKAASQA